MILRNVSLVGLFVLLLICKTGEIDKNDLLSEKINFEISDHLYPGINVKAITIVGADHWFYALGRWKIHFLYPLKFGTAR